MRVFVKARLVGVDVDDHNLRVWSKLFRTRGERIRSRVKAYSLAIADEEALEQLCKLAMAEGNDRRLFTARLRSASALETTDSQATHLATLLPLLVFTEDLHALPEHHERLVDVSRLLQPIACNGKPAGSASLSIRR